MDMEVVDIVLPEPVFAEGIQDFQEGIHPVYDDEGASGETEHYQDMALLPDYMALNIDLLA